ncbi:MAG TPA: glycerophosphodiester phosphodiesterase family protein [Streptosporangiaceae bacterium]
MVQISAHKGGSERARPQTYEAYQDALASGAEYAEFDIRKTADDVLVIYHDAAAGGTRLADVGYQELCDRAGYPVPRAEEVMQLLGGRLAGHLDLKETGYEERVISLALAFFGAGNFVATTLEDVSVRRIKQAFPAVRTALSLGRDLQPIPRRRWAGVRRGELFPLRRLRACGADLAAVNYKLARLGVLGTCARHGIPAMVWTVDADELIDRFVTDPRIAVLITNRPRQAVRRRAELDQHRPR